MYAVWVWLHSLWWYLQSSSSSKWIGEHFKWMCWWLFRMLWQVKDVPQMLGRVYQTPRWQLKVSSVWFLASRTYWFSPTLLKRTTQLWKSSKTLQISRKDRLETLECYSKSLRHNFIPRLWCSRLCFECSFSCWIFIRNKDWVSLWLKWVIPPRLWQLELGLQRRLVELCNFNAFSKRSNFRKGLQIHRQIH